MRTQIWVNEWYYIHNIKFQFVNKKIKIKSNQKLKFDITYKVEVKAITIIKMRYDSMKWKWIVLKYETLRIKIKHWF